MAYTPRIDAERDLQRWAPYVLAAVAGLMLFLAFKREVPAPPRNALVFGCYKTEEGPPINLSEAGMQIGQEGFPTLRFHLERHKQGIALAAEAPIEAEPTETGYKFHITESGIGRFLDFYKLLNGEIYGVLDEDGLQGFRMLANDGRYLPYDKAAQSDCTF